MSTTAKTASSLKRNWWKIIILAFAFSIFYALLHGMLPSNEQGVLPPSIIVQSGLLPVAFILYGALWFGLLACIFTVVQNRLPGGKLIKGLVYGLFFFVIVFMTYFEPLPHVSSISHEMAWMLGDGAPLLLLGVLLGLFLASGKDVTDKTSARKERTGRKKVAAVLVIPLLFLAGRLLDYTVLNIYSDFSAQPIATLVWVFLFGLVIGVMYYMLRSAVKQSSQVKTAVFFGGVMFGLYVFLFNFAFPLIVHMDFLPIGSLTIVDLAVRVFMDALFITLGVLVFEYLAKPKAN